MPLLFAPLVPPASLRARFKLFNPRQTRHSAVDESNVLLRTITADEALGGLESCPHMLHSSKSNRTYRLPRARRKPPPSTLFLRRKSWQPKSHTFPRTTTPSRLT